MIEIQWPAHELLPNAVENNATSEPNRVVYEYPNSPTTYDLGFTKITTVAFNNAVNGVAHWLEQSLGRKGQDFEAVAYIGLNDLRYLIFIVGAIKSGYKAVLLSPRNSLIAQKDIMEKTACKLFVTTSPMPAAAEAITTSLPDLTILTIPTLEKLILSKHPHYPYGKTWETAADEPMVVIHTSGSTGIPKPIVITHRFACRLANVYTIKPPEGYWALNSLWVKARVHLLLPLFHAAGIINFINSTYLGNTIVLPASGLIPTAQGLVEVARQTRLGVAQVSPATLRELSHEPRLISELLARGHEYFFYAGGDLPQGIGDKISRLFKLFTVMGATEIGAWPQVRKVGGWDHENWDYVAPRPNAGIEFVQRTDELYEQVVVRKPEFKDIQPAFVLFPELQEYYLKDLYSKHPSQPGLWKFRGRSDDIIVFLNGEKTNPITFEHTVGSHPDVSGALVAGAQRWEACLLVEVQGNPAISPQERSTYLDKIWPLVEQANQECPAHARISKSLVLFTKQEKPMARAGKGTIQRQATVALYKDEIDSLYKDAETINEQVSTTKISVENALTLANGIKQEVQTITQWREISLDDDWFARGMDSLQVLLLSRNLRSATKLQVTPSMVYNNATANRLALAALEIVSHNRYKAGEKSEKVAANIIRTYELLRAQIDLLVSSHNTTHCIGTSTNGNRRGQVVILTGSSGSLGSFMLDSLLLDTSVSHVYCLNRAQNSEAIQRERSAQRGLSTELFNPDKVTFLSANLGLEGLGLSHEQFNKLRSSVTCIIHNAWPVNFNLALEAFDQPLKSVVNLTALAATSTHRASMFFISSIGSVMGLAAKLSHGELVPEKIFDDPLAGLDMAYGQSKYIGERLIDYASHAYGVRASAVRVGQIAGPAFTNGIWSRQEWVPSLVISSVHIGSLPETLSSIAPGGKESKEIDWVPVDLLAKGLIELALGDTHPGVRGVSAKVFHPLNPRPVTWSSLLPSILHQINERSSTYGSSADKVKIVSLGHWIKLLRQSGKELEADDASIDALLKINPGVKLLSFYEEMAAGGDEGEVRMGGKLSITNAGEGSETLRNLDGVNPEWMGKWVEGWLRE